LRVVRLNRAVVSYRAKDADDGNAVLFVVGNSHRSFDCLRWSRIVARQIGCFAAAVTDAQDSRVETTICR
jgi:hypothetical protein